MKKVLTVVALRKQIKQWRSEGLSIAFVPTMGNLHAGHISLVSQARLKADKVVVSIFVNPTQFGAGEDFNSYPRTESADEARLVKASADLLFLPEVAEMYDKQASTSVSVANLSDLHCGAHRPGHFDGVATVVCKLFNMVQPDMAFFGNKDFQQLSLIKIMVKDLDIPVQIVGVETEREKDGLAMSSRNGFLTEQERKLAPALYQKLIHAQDFILKGRQDFRVLEKELRQQLTDSGFKVDYFSICRTSDLELAEINDKDLVILVAAKLGKPRLIDNISFSTETRQ